MIKEKAIELFNYYLERTQYRSFNPHSTSFTYNDTYSTFKFEFLLSKGFDDQKKLILKINDYPAYPIELTNQEYAQLYESYNLRLNKAFEELINVIECKIQKHTDKYSTTDNSN